MTQRAVLVTPLARAIIVCALGYFIDVFDIQLFPVLRAASLTDLGVPAARLASVSGDILSIQMFGMVVGAFLWGWLGDRLGRLKALYGSIIVYSVGTLACSLVHDPFTYGALRFFTGFGLSGETGAAITLIAEMMPREKRGWGIILVAGVGFLGPVFAVLVAWFFPWRVTYVVAGLLGLAILILRMRLVEPAMFEKISRSAELRGSLRLVFQRHQGWIFACCVMIGLPFAFSWNLLNFFSLEFGHAVLKEGEVFDQRLCLLLFYIGTSCGDFLSGAATQLWRSRRKAMSAVYLIGVVAAAFYLMLGPQIGFTAVELYVIYLAIGIAGGGGWILFSTIAAEQFGTNIRATTAIVVINLVRGFAIPMVFVFQILRQVMSITNAAALIGLVLYALAFFALSRLRETHGLDLDYVESISARASK